MTGTAQIYFDPAKGAWIVRSYDLVQALLRDNRLAPIAASHSGEQSVLFRKHLTQPLRLFFSDTAHADTAACVHSAIRDSFAALWDVPRANLAQDLCAAIPPAVMAGLMGIPRADIASLTQLAAPQLTAYDSGSNSAPGPNTVSMTMLRAYFAKHLAQLRSGATPPLMTVIQAAQSVQDIPADVLNHFIAKLWIAGTTTTGALLANITARLLQTGAARQIAALPEGDKTSALREFTRLDAPVLALKRRAIADVPLSGATVPAGAYVILRVAAANCDPARYDAPHDFNPSRTGPAPLTFGRGVQFCIGAALAEAEILCFLDQMLPQLHRFTLVSEPVFREATLLREATDISITIAPDGA